MVEVQAEAVECTGCKVTMTAWSSGHAAPGVQVTLYYRCPRCNRTLSAFYDEVFQRSAGVRRVGASAAPPRPPQRPAPAPESPRPPSASPLENDPRWSQVKARAAAWFERLDREDARKVPATPPAVPDVSEASAVLGVAPTAEPEELRAAYHRAALAFHPDRGGDGEAMARVNRAYQALRSARAAASAFAPLPSRTR